MMKLEPCQIIGVLDDGTDSLSKTALSHLHEADLVIGVGRTLKLFESCLNKDAEQRDMTAALMKTPDWIRAAQEEGKRVVLLATGDPLCHGIGSFLQSRLCIEAVEILPNLSMMQLACARLGIPWQELKICSIHSKDVGEWAGHEDFSHGLYPLLREVQKHDRLAVYTSPENSPDRIARMLVAEGLDEDFNMAVAERLALPNEKIITDLSIKQAADHNFAHPNLVVLWRKGLRNPSQMFGLADDLFKQRKPDKGLITKREIRAVSLARMQLRRGSVVWDIGAGSGAVGLEAARLSSNGFVYAIEKNQADFDIALSNKHKHNIHNYKLMHGKAPDGLQDWPDPDAIFIGGSGGNLDELICLCLDRLKPGGTLVMNFVTLENLATATDTLKQAEAQWDVTQMQISRSKPILHMNRLVAQNPVWIISATPKRSDDENC